MRAAGAAETGHDRREPRGIVGRLGAMHGRKDVTLRRQAETRRRLAVGARYFAPEAVIHDVADQMRVAPSFPREIVDGRPGRTKQEVGEPVGDDTVDLLGHAAAERAQTGFDMGEPHRRLGRDQRRRQGRVGVAVDQHDVGMLRLDDRLEPRHDGAGLRGMAAAADAQMVLRRRDAEIVEEDLRQLRIVVLTGVHDGLPQARRIPDRAAGATRPRP